MRNAAMAAAICAAVPCFAGLFTWSRDAQSVSAPTVSQTTFALAVRDRPVQVIVPGTDERAYVVTEQTWRSLTNRVALLERVAHGHFAAAQCAATNAAPEIVWITDANEEEQKK